MALTLAEMADFICTKVRHTDEDAVAACKSFLRQRYKVIYDSQLWRDTLYVYRFTFQVDGSITSAIPNSVQNAATGHWFLPTVVDKVVALRSDDNPIESVGEEVFYQADLDTYEDTGLPVQFVHRSPAVWMKPVAAQLNFNFDGGANDNGTAVEIVYIDAEQNKRKRTIAVTQTSTAIETDTAGILLVESVRKPTTTYPLVMEDLTSDPLPQVPTLTGAASATSIQQYKRIQVSPIPTEDTMMRALVKQTMAPLEEDIDVPGLDGVENCLLAFAHGDMLQRARQYAKAQLLHSEAAALLAEFTRTQVYQRANRPRIVPRAEGSGGSAESQQKGYW